MFTSVTVLPLGPAVKVLLEIVSQSGRGTEGARLSVSSSRGGRSDSSLIVIDGNKGRGGASIADLSLAPSGAIESRSELFSRAGGGLLLLALYPVHIRARLVLLEAGMIALEAAS